MTTLRQAWAKSGRPAPMTTTEAAQVAHVSRRTISRAVAVGELRAWRRGRLVRILDRDLEEWLLDRGGT